MDALLLCALRHAYISSRKEDFMVKVNGQQVDAIGQNLKDYLVNEGYELDRIVVEVNLEIIAKDKLGDVVIKDNDSIEVLSFVGGG